MIVAQAPNLGSCRGVIDGEGQEALWRAVTSDRLLHTDVKCAIVKRCVFVVCSFVQVASRSCARNGHVRLFGAAVQTEELFRVAARR